MKKRTAVFVMIAAICCISFVLTKNLLWTETENIESLETDARITQRIPNAYTAYTCVKDLSLRHESDETRQATAFLFSSKEMDDFVYAFYLGEDFVMGGKPILDANNPISFERTKIDDTEIILFFSKGNVEGGEAIFEDNDGNILKQIMLVNEPMIQILEERELIRATVCKIRMG